MTAGLQITLQVQRGTPRTVELGASALVGSGRAADLRVPDPAIAPLHLRLLRDGGEVTAIALAAGVFADGHELVIDESTAVAGRTIDVGPLRLTVAARDVTVEETAVRGRTESLAREMVRDLMGGDAGGEGLVPELVVDTGPATGQRLPLPRNGHRIVVGRGEHAGWVLLDPDLSRSHAAFIHEPDGVRVYDLGSKNGTRIAGKAVPIGPPGVLLEDGATIGLGDTQVRFLDPAGAMLAELEGRMSAATSGAHAAATLTRRGHGQAVIAVDPPEPSRPPPRRRRLSLAVIIAGLVALISVALLLALLSSS